MKKILIGIGITIFIILVFLSIPLIFKNRSHTKLIGPDLSEFQFTEISFNNQSAGFSLGGMVFLPEGQGPFPTAIIIHGSGPSARNSVWYLSVTKHLQSNGIAVLLPDKRGCEKSGGNWVGASIEELATDTVSAVEYVLDQKLFTYSSIGLIGMSQGGWIAPVAANKTKSISWIVSMSGATVTTDEQMNFEAIYNIEPYTYEFIARLIAPITVDMLREKPHIKALFGFDPISYWKNVHVPVFFAFGENDSNVPVAKSIKRLEENGLDHHKIEIYRAGGHAIFDRQTSRVSKSFLDDLVKFIKAVKPDEYST